MLEPSATAAIRALVSGRVQGVGFRVTVADRARRLGLLGWVRNAEGQALQVHAEGDPEALAALVAFLHEGPPSARVTSVQVQDTKVEGHEQFAIRGVSAGAFVVVELAAPSHQFELRLEVGAVMRTWTIPKGPSLDPVVKRLALAASDRSRAENAFEGPREGGGVIVWDRGSYEQGGRVAWPEALDRGHAVFVLHGEKLAGGFALQRPRPGPQWLLIKRRDQQARSGSDIVAQRPGSVLSGRDVDEIIG